MWVLILINLIGKLASIYLGWSTPLVSLSLWLMPDALLAYHIFVPRAQGAVRMPGRFRPAGREVWLTIDDGPNPEDTPRILELLASHQARATFFVIGERALLHPELIRAIVAAGHQVAHHTHTHPLSDFWCASPRRVARELDAGIAALALAGVKASRFRPPAGIKNLWLAKALHVRGLLCVGWSARGLERWHKDPQAVLRCVTQGLAPGAILLLHEGAQVPSVVRVTAIRLVLEHLQEQGYRCIVPKSEQFI